MSDASLPHDPDRSSSSQGPGWDAYAVWRTRVLRPTREPREAADPSGWDPYSVWRNRVKK